MAHSKGPWRMCSAYGGACPCGQVWESGGGRVVALVVKEDDDHLKSPEAYAANARLIAAAPEMLEMLKSVCDPYKDDAIAALIARIAGDDDGT